MVNLLKKRSLMMFFAGVFSVITVLLLTGAASQNPVGKYELQVIVKSRITHVYVMDTTTGAVKWINSMNTPFDELKDN